jgi:hypothetical protein
MIDYFISKALDYETEQDNFEDFDDEEEEIDSKDLACITSVL